MRDHSKLRAFELDDEHDSSTYESKIVEAEKVLGALLQSVRK